ncbi:hypothetical protein OEA41_002991 [Lepraria neglecta]|uniref:Uncharacterized protein n=1 Tax=Lepraria neglecta TaxID=209136 RepID=A0AAE0DHX6_9LECA|nr:hypothetical protein OEA41_002991 [Lepraria neglecta]
MAAVPATGGNSTVVSAAPFSSSIFTTDSPHSSSVLVSTPVLTFTSFTSVTSPDVTLSTPEPTTAPVAVLTQPQAPPSTHVITSVLPASTDAAGNAQSAPETIIVTSTQSNPVFPTDTTTPSSSSSKSSSSTSGSAALATAGAIPSTTSGLSAGGKIAVAVVVPVVAVALIVIAALFLWRKRRQRKEAEELRRKEVEEYGFNPNHDPTLPVIVGGASSVGDEPSEMRETDGAGYRGWGTATTSARKPSTTLSSGAGAIGVARSTSGSDNGRYNGSPTAGTDKSSGVQSGDPLVGSPPNGRPLSDDSETIGALGAVPSNGNRQDIHRGPSNASSAYSGAHRSDTSGEGAIPGGAPGQQYYNDGLYYDEGMPQHGPYGDGSYGGGQPVIRDVQARRNTRIENPSIIPQQGNAGIAQNF